MQTFSHGASHRISDLPAKTQPFLIGGPSKNNRRLLGVQSYHRKTYYISGMIPFCEMRFPKPLLRGMPMGKFILGG